MKKRDPASREEVESLLAQARHYATHMMRTTGSVPPTLMAVTPEGFMMYVPSGMADDDAKDRFAKTGRLLAVGYRASAVAMILESWATFAKPGKPLATTLPSQSAEREEVVVIMAEAHGCKAQQFLFIQRNSLGAFTGFGTSLVPQFDDMEGRFAAMMPAKPVGEAEAVTARTLLKAMGVGVTNAGFNPLWN